MTTPFLILSLPRSRSYWLSRFLSFGSRTCDHEPSRNFRSDQELYDYLDRFDLAACDTGMALIWRKILPNFPNIQIVTVRRPVNEVSRSIKALGRWHRPITEGLRREEILLDSLESVHVARRYEFDDLDDDEVCADLFEYCLGHKPPDGWMCQFMGVNLQCDVDAVFADMRKNQAGIRAVYDMPLNGIA